MAAEQDEVVDRWDNIAKQEGDERSYLGLRLKNGMKVLLISDSNTDKAAIALDVNIGYNCDPTGLAGLAHLCEHMLFSAFKRIDEDDIYNYILTNGGKSNASTYLDHTLYHFEFDSDNLCPILQYVFSKLFLSFSSDEECFKASFKTDNITKHLNIMDREYNVNLCDDTWRLAQVDKKFMKENHPVREFNMSSKPLVKVAVQDVKQEYKKVVLDFYKEYYSASVMTLCVLGKEDLRVLERTVIDAFSKMPSHNVNIPSYDKNLYPDDQFKIKIYMKPLRDTHSIMLRFPLWSKDHSNDLEHSKHHHTEIMNYFSYLLESQEEGTLLSVLKSKAWCHSLVCGKLTIAKNIISYFNIAVDLTTIGLDHIDEIITLVFQYIAMLKEEGPLEEVFDECRKIVDANSRYDAKPPLSYVISKAQEMQIHPVDTIVYVNRTTFTFENWGKNLITEIMNCLSPQYVRVYIVSNNVHATFSKDFDGIEYCREEIPEITIDNWTKSSEVFKRPTLMSQFMATNFDILGDPEARDIYPVIITNEPTLRIWYKQNNEFPISVPKSYIIINFVSYGSYSADDTILKTVFVELISDSFKSLPYASEVAGLKWQFFSNHSGVTFTISGYNEKQHLLVENFLDHFIRYEVNGSSIRRLRFDVVTEKFKKVVKQYAELNPYQYATFALTILLWEKAKLSMPEAYGNMDMDVYICIENVARCLRDFLERLHVECFIYGNTTKEEATKISKTISRKIDLINPTVEPPSPDSDFMNIPREHKLDKHCNLTYYTISKHYNTSCAVVYYQDGIRHEEQNVMLDLLVQIISEPCQVTLKTTKKLGYKIFCHAYKLNSTQGLKFVVVQKNTDNRSKTQNIEKEIDVFVNSIHTRIARMTPTDFNKHKQILLASRQRTRKTFDAAVAMFWDEILTQQYVFDRITKEENILNSLTKKKLQDYCKTFLHSTTKRKMSIYIIHLNEDDRLSKIGSKLENWRDFKNPQFSHSLLIRDKYPRMCNGSITYEKVSCYSSTSYGEDEDDEEFDEEYDEEDSEEEEDTS